MHEAKNKVCTCVVPQESLNNSIDVVVPISMFWHLRFSVFIDFRSFICNRLEIVQGCYLKRRTAYRFARYPLLLYITYRTNVDATLGSATSCRKRKTLSVTNIAERQRLILFLLCKSSSPIHQCKIYFNVFYYQYHSDLNCSMFSLKWKPTSKSI